MNNKQIYIYCFLIIAFFIQIDKVIAKDNVVFPSPKMLEVPVNKSQIIFENTSSSKNNIFPNRIFFEISNYKIVGIIVKYDDSLTFKKVEDTLNLFYSKWRRKRFDDVEFLRLWRVEDQKFAINLSKDDEGNLQIIFIPFSNSISGSNE